MVHPAVASFGIADAPPVVEFLDHLQRQAGSFKHPRNLIGLARANTHVGRPGFQADKSWQRQPTGFPDLPIMEDYELMRRLRRAGRVSIAPGLVVTSGRRWLRGGVWRTTLTNQACVVAYRLGVAPSRIATWRASMTSRRASNERVAE